jgi:hypothetical protein
VPNKPTEVIGTRHGKLTIVGDPEWREGKRYLSCRCDCGVVKLIRASRLGTKTNSCGCARYDKHRARIQHGEARNGKCTPEYAAWGSMLNRCYSAKSQFFKHYGGRGITVCDAWRNSYESFLSDVGRRPSSDHSLDRIDNNGNYEPGNVRWATHIEQHRNRRNSVVLEFHGEKLTLVEWAERLGVKYNTLHERIRRGWSIERVLKEACHGPHR